MPRMLKQCFNLANLINWQFCNCLFSGVCALTGEQLDTFAVDQSVDIHSLWIRCLQRRQVDLSKAMRYLVDKIKSRLSDILTGKVDRWNARADGKQRRVIFACSTAYLSRAICSLRFDISFVAKNAIRRPVYVYLSLRNGLIKRRITYSPTESVFNGLQTTTQAGGRRLREEYIRST